MNPVKIYRNPNKLFVVEYPGNDIREYVTSNDFILQLIGNTFIAIFSISQSDFKRQIPFRILKATHYTDIQDESGTPIAGTFQDVVDYIETTLGSSTAPLVSLDQTVDQFDDLPSPAIDFNGQYWLVDLVQGSNWTLNRKDPGIYKSVGGAWDYRGPDTPAYFRDDQLLFKDDAGPGELTFTLDDLTARRDIRWPDKSGIPAFIDDISMFESTGMVDFSGIIVNAGDNTLIDISILTALFVNINDPLNIIITEKTFAANNAYNLTTTAPVGDNVVIYLSVDLNGIIVEKTSPLTNRQRRDLISIGAVVRSDADVIFLHIPEYTNFVLSAVEQFHDLLQAQGTFKISGNVVTPNASLTMMISSGVMFQNGANVSVDNKNPHAPSQIAANPFTFNEKLSNGTDLGLTSTLDPNFYDDGSSIPTAMPNNDFQVMRISRFPSTGLVEILLGQETFNTMQNAIDAILRIQVEFLVPPDSLMSVPLYWLIVKQGTLDLTTVANASFIPIITGNSGVSTVIGVQRFVLVNENFESGSFVTNGWIAVNGAEVNKWEVGTDTANTGANSAYISDDAGVSNNYDVNSASVVHFYQDFTFPTDAEDCYLSFWFKGEGEDGFDFMSIFVVETSVNPTDGVSLSGTDYQLSATDFTDGEFNLQTDWKFIKIWITPQILAGQTKRFVFSWENDISLGSNPPVAIDDIKLTYQK